MFQKLLRDPRVYELLLRLDRDLADQTRAKGCRCGGRLDSATFPRKPRGGPPVPPELKAAEPDHSRRLSLCCDVCRKRTTPPSVRFVWRRFYLAATVLLLSALRDGLTPRRVARLHALHGVSRHTLERWRAWWRDAFVLSDLWKAARGRFTPAVDEEEIVRSLLLRFGALGTRAGLVGALRFLAPLGASAHACRGAISDPQRMSFDLSGGAS